MAAAQHMTPLQDGNSQTSDVPTISVVMPVLNEERRLPRALRSLAVQDYPRDLIEVIVADGGSVDRSVHVAKSFSDQLKIRVLDNSFRREAEAGKALGLQRASGELVLSLDADMWLTSRSYLRRLARPLVADDTLVGSVAAYEYSPCLPLWSRFLSLDEFQRDPLLQVLTPSMERFIIERHSDYDVCEFRTKRIPPIGGTTVYRRRAISTARWRGVWRDIDQAAYLVSRGHRRFAYVGRAGVAHEHAASLRDLVRKRLRNALGLTAGYIQLDSEADFIWINLSDRSEVLRLVQWIVGTNLLVPRLIEGIRDAIATGRSEALLRPVAAVAVTDALLWGLVSSREGRQYIRQILRRFVDW